MDLDDLRLLLQVVDEGSVHAAATKLGVSRTTLRRRIDNLESRVGAAVLLRGPAGIRLTPAGEVVARCGRALVEQTAAMLAEAKATEDEMAATIRVVTPVGGSFRVHLACIQLIKAHAPAARIELREVEDPLEHLHDPFDLLVAYTREPPAGAWYSRVLLRTPMSVLASPAYLSHAGVPLDLDSLSMHRMLMWRRRDAPVDRWPVASGGTVPVRPSLVSSNLGLLREACRAGEGLLFAPTEPPPGDPSDELVPVLEDRITDELVVRTVTPHPSTSDSRARTVLSNLLEAIGRE